jgi:hypothetical protein
MKLMPLTIQNRQNLEEVKQEDERKMTLIKKINLYFLYALKQASTFFPLN